MTNFNYIMKQLKSGIIALFTLVFILSSCEDKDLTIDGLSYTLNDSKTVLKTDSTVASSADNAIVGYANGGRAVFTIYMSSLTVGTYTILSESKATKRKNIVAASPEPYFYLYYTPTANVYFWGTVGTLTIKEVKNNTLSGSFEIKDGNEDSQDSEPINTIKGSFNNIPVVSRYIAPR